MGAVAGVRDMTTVPLPLRSGHTGGELRRMADRLGIGAERIGHIVTQIRVEEKRKGGREG